MGLGCALPSQILELVAEIEEAGPQLLMLLAGDVAECYWRVRPAKYSLKSLYASLIVSYLIC